MAKYVKQEMPDIHKTGENKCYYRLKRRGNVNVRRLLREICAHGGNSLSEGVMLNAYVSLLEEMTRKLSEGYSVTLDGLGTFSASIGVVEGGEDETWEEGGVRRNAASMEFKNVNFRTDKEWITHLRKRCVLEKAGESRLAHSPFSREERLRKAVEYLSDSSHPFMRIADYAKLTGLSLSSATRELRAFREDSSTEIEGSGCGPAIVYVLASRRKTL